MALSFYLAGYKLKEMASITINDQIEQATLANNSQKRRKKEKKMRIKVKEPCILKLILLEMSSEEEIMSHNKRLIEDILKESQL